MHKVAIERLVCAVRADAVAKRHVGEDEVKRLARFKLQDILVDKARAAVGGGRVLPRGVQGALGDVHTDQRGRHGALQLQQQRAAAAERVQRARASRGDKRERIARKAGRLHGVNRRGQRAQAIGKARIRHVPRADEQIALVVVADDSELVRIARGVIPAAKRGGDRADERRPVAGVGAQLDSIRAGQNRARKRRDPLRVDGQIAPEREQQLLRAPQLLQGLDLVGGHMHAVGLQRRDKSARSRFLVENLAEPNRRNQEDFARLGEARALRERDVPRERGFCFLQRFQNVGNVLLLGLVRRNRRNKREDGFSGAAVCDGAEREQDGGDHEARLLRLQG